MIHGVSHVSFLIRRSSDLRLCAPTRSLSQLITSFIGSWCQGIHHAPFVAWPLFVHYVLLLHRLRNLLVHVSKVLFTTYISRFLVLSHTKLHNNLLFQSFAFNITKNISWLTSQYVLKLYYIIHMQFSKNKLVGLNGLEPSTSRLSGVRSNQLSYRPIKTKSGWRESNSRQQLGRLWFYH